MARGSRLWVALNLVPAPVAFKQLISGALVPLTYRVPAARFSLGSRSLKNIFADDGTWGTRRHLATSRARWLRVRLHSREAGTGIIRAKVGWGDSRRGKTSNFDASGACTRAVSDRSRSESCGNCRRNWVHFGRVESAVFAAPDKSSAVLSLSWCSGSGSCTVQV
jgi:hypothetical protein